MVKVIVVFGVNCVLGVVVVKSLVRDSNFMVKVVDLDGFGLYFVDIWVSGV